MRKIILLVIIFSLLSPTAWAGTAKVLDNDTDLHPQGWIAGGTLQFKPGSQVELNEKGEVISGTLKFNEYLRSVGKGDEIIRPSDVLTPSNFLPFKGYDSIVTFDEHGLVTSGTLEHSVWIYLVPDTEPQIKLRGNTVVLFDKNGNLKSGTLNEDYYLRPLGGGEFLPSTTGFVKFKAGTEVTFGANAQVIKGTIVNDLTVNGTTYPAGTTLQFSETSLPQVAQ